MAPWGAFHSTKISGNFGLKLNGTVRSNRKSFEKIGPPLEVDHFFWLDRSDQNEPFRPTLNPSTSLCGTFAWMSVVSPTSRFAYKSIRLHRGRFADTTKSFRLHSLSRFAYIKVVSPTLISRNIF